MYKQYLKQSFFIFFLTMLSIASINFIVDPGEIYLKKIVANWKSSMFSEQLFKSKNGIVQTGWNERLVKTILAKVSNNFECIILGSSHISQISGIRNTGNINNKCKETLNLGVSGGSIEDIAIFSYLILNHETLPKQVFIGIDPWTLKFGMDGRFGAYRNYYELMNSILKKRDKGDSVSYLSQAAGNLFNGEYLYNSIKNINKKTDDSIFEKKIIYPNKNFSYKTGYSEAVTLPDGSGIYASTYIKEQMKINKNIKLGGGMYKISGAYYDNSAVDYLERLLHLYKLRGVNVNIILTPYHPNVFKLGETKAVEHFRIIENTVQDFVLKNNIRLYGSFFPIKIGCKGEEFYDFMHPTNECLNRINFSQ